MQFSGPGPHILSALAAAAVLLPTTVLAAATVPAAHPQAPQASPVGTQTSLQTITLDPVAATSALPPPAHTPPATHTPPPAHTPSASTPGASRASTPGAAPGAAPMVVAVAARSTQPFSLLGVTWTDPDDRPAGTVQVRTRSAADHRWSPWRALDADEPSAAEPDLESDDVRGSTEALWVGPSDGVEARLSTPTGQSTRGLPAGARLDLIDPGTEPQQPAARSGPTMKPAAAEVILPGRPVPRLVTRAGWNADESLNRHAPDYTSDVQTLFVHHTAGANDYSCADSPKIIRSIHAYHVRSKHWNDVGYNFLVDRCGTLYEGRAGGVSQPVLGAHTMGFNSRSTGIAVLGNYDGRGVTARVRGVIAQVAAYKIGMSGNSTAGSVLMTSSGSNKWRAGTQVRMNRISGHRNAVSTECPGDTLYGQLRTIRDLADEPVTALSISQLAGAARIGETFFSKGPVTLTWGVHTPTAMLARFEILVDGTLVAARPPAHRSVALNLAPGQHTVRVRAVPLAGAARTSAAWTVVADATAPQFTQDPAIALRTGSLAGTVPVTLSWQATDAVGLRTVTLSRPTVRAFAPTATRWHTTARPAVATTWSIRAADGASNADYATVTRTPVVMSEVVATRDGAWGVRSSTGYLGGTALVSATPGATLSWNFTGHSAALAFTRTTTSGQVKVYVDGVQATVLDLRATAIMHRQAMFVRNWPTSGNHTVTIEVVGTAGRPNVISDGLVRLS